MSYKYIDSHFAQAIERVIEQHKDKPNFENLLKVFLERTQDQEDDLKNQAENRTLSGARGAQLDAIARDLNLRRDGDSDSRLRIRCFSQIAQHYSSGRIEQIVSILRLLVEAREVRMTEIFPAKITVEIRSDFPFDSSIRQVIERALAAGVGLDQVIVSVSIRYFGFSNDAQASGFILTPGSEDGGRFSIILE